MTRLLGIFAAAIVALGLTAPKAEAVVIYDWTGTCTGGCAGQASAVLTLVDSYTPGDLASILDVISFSYSSSSGAYDVPADTVLAFASATLPAVSGEGMVNLIFVGAGAEFRPNTSMSWTSHLASAGVDDRGTDNTWTLRQPTELSAPGPLSLLALGLTGLALAGRRRGERRLVPKSTHVTPAKGEARVSGLA